MNTLRLQPAPGYQQPGTEPPPQGTGPRAIIKHPCGHKIFDGEAIKSRVLKVLPSGECVALCRCKAWVQVPLVYSPIRS